MAFMNKNCLVVFFTLIMACTHQSETQQRSLNLASLHCLMEKHERLFQHHVVVKFEENSMDFIGIARVDRDHRIFAKGFSDFGIEILGFSAQMQEDGSSYPIEVDLHHFPIPLRSMKEVVIPDVVRVLACTNTWTDQKSTTGSVISRDHDGNFSIVSTDMDITIRGYRLEDPN